MQDIKNEEYIICPRCGREVYKEAVTCPFCNFGILVWLEGEINENGEVVKKVLSKFSVWRKHKLYEVNMIEIRELRKQD